MSLPGEYIYTLAANNQLEKKMLERKGARAEFELITSNTTPNQRKCNSNDGRPSHIHDDVFFLDPSISSHKDIERGGPENAPWEGLLQNLSHQPESIGSSPSPGVGSDSGTFMDLGILGGSGQPGIDGIAGDLNTSGSNCTSGFQHQLLPSESNIATASWPNIELESSGDSSYFSPWSPNTGASSGFSSSPAASIKSSYQPQYRMEVPSPASQSSLTKTATPGLQLLPPLLHVSAQTGNRGVLQSLLKHGAAVNEPDSHGRTALHVASEYGHDMIVSLLLAHGADSEALDRDGKSPLYTAVTASQNEVVDTLLRHRQ